MLLAMRATLDWFGCATFRLTLGPQGGGQVIFLDAYLDRVPAAPSAGLLPEQVYNLFDAARLRIRADRMGICGIEAGPSGGSIDFKETTSVNPLSLVTLVQSDPKSYKLAGATRLRFERDLSDKLDRQQFVEQLLDTFATDATDAA